MKTHSLVFVSVMSCKIILSYYSFTIHNSLMWKWFLQSWVIASRLLAIGNRSIIHLHKVHARICSYIAGYLLSHSFTCWKFKQDTYSSVYTGIKAVWIFKLLGGNLLWNAYFYKYKIPYYVYNYIFD